MQHLNLTLRLALLCLLMAGTHSLAVAEQLEPDVIAARDALETDPVLVAQTEQYELAFEAWREELICHLLQPWQAPLVRLRAVNAQSPLIASPEGASQLPCPQGAEPAISDDVRRQVLRDGWNQADIVMSVFWSSCFREQAPDWCDRDAIFEQLQLLEPHNAAVQLLPILSGSFLQIVRADEHPDPGKKVKAIRDIELEPSATEKTRSMLAAAAAASTRFDLHYAAGFEATYQAIENYLQRHPAPEPTPQLELALAAAGSVPLVPAESAMWSIWAGLLQEAMLGYSDIIHSCDDHAKAADEKAVEDCLAIAILMQQAPTMIVSSVGHHLQRRMEHPEYIGSTALEQQDPQYWKRDFSMIIARCQSPKIYIGFANGYAVPPSHIRLFYSELEQLGEREAYKRVAIREYALYPELFDADPARCEAAYELDEATQRDVVALWRSDKGGDWQAAVQLLDELTRP